VRSINDQVRLCFAGKEDGAYDVEIVDYHRERKGGNRVPLVRPAHGWNYQYVTTSPGEMLAEEFLKPLGLSQHRLAMSIHVPSTRIGEIVRGKRDHSRHSPAPGPLLR
jgi:hypothetical protein